jgi:hypothetical protein
MQTKASKYANRDIAITLAKSERGTMIMTIVDNTLANAGLASVETILEFTPGQAEALVSNIQDTFLNHV